MEPKGEENFRDRVQQTPLPNAAGVMLYELKQWDKVQESM